MSPRHELCSSPVRKGNTVRRKDGTRDALDNSDGTTDFVVAGLDRRRRWQLNTPAALSRVGRIDFSIDHRSTSRSLMILVSRRSAVNFKGEV